MKRCFKPGNDECVMKWGEEDGTEERKLAGTEPRYDGENQRRLDPEEVSVLQTVRQDTAVCGFFQWHSGLHCMP